MSGLRVVAALDSFKGSVDSETAGRAVRAGVLTVDPTAQVVVRAVADGGEGTLTALVGALGGRELPVDSVDALGRPTTASIGLVERDGRRTAIVEAARSIGLADVGVVDESLPPRASSYGVGLQLRAALDLHVDRVLVGLGGTATTDGGAGLLAALGATLVEENAEDGEVVDGARGNPLWRGVRLRTRSLPHLAVDLRVLTDVGNPLTGPDGAAAVFGPQKGATPDQVRLLDDRLVTWGRSLAAETGRDVGRTPGAGAAGGIAAALMALGGAVEPGFDRIAEETGLAAAIADADLVFTGEGAIDGQTSWGKTPAGVAGLARGAGAVVVALGGRVDRAVDAGPFDAVLPIHSRPRSLAEAMDPAVTSAELAATAAEVVRLVRGSGRMLGSRVNVRR